MEQYNMRANFYPVKEPINGFIGSADLTVSNIIRLKGIAVFQNREDNGHHIQFPGFDGGDGMKSHITPHSPEAFQQMMGVIEKAISAEDHFGHVAGKQKAFLSVSGKAVNEPFADGRYDLKVADLFTVHNITSQKVAFTKDGKEESFIAVRVPSLPPYEKGGEKIYPPMIKGLKSTYEVEGKTQQTDYAQIIQALVISERKKILGKPPLEAQVQDAAGKAAQGAPAKDAPAPEAQR